MSGKKNRGYFGPYIDYQIGKQNGWNPWNPYGYFTQAGIADRQREQRRAAEKKEQEERARRVGMTPDPIISPYRSPDLTQYSSPTPAYSYGSYRERPRSLWPRFFHGWWWREIGLFSLWEEIGDRMVGAEWPLRLLSGFVTALIFLGVALEWPWVGAHLRAFSPGAAVGIVVSAGAVVGFVLPPLLGRILLLVRAVLVIAIVVTLRLSVVAAAAALVYRGILLVQAHR